MKYRVPFIVWLLFCAMIILFASSRVWVAADSPRNGQNLHAAETSSADAAMRSIRPDAIRAHMRFLADDLLEGRATGSRGYDIGAKYMATQFEALGLAPAGDAGTYFQNIPYRSLHVDQEKTALSLFLDGHEQRMVFGRDFLSYGDPDRPEATVEAPIVFVGNGITAPEQNYDDYRDVDAQGKIVAFFYNAPNFESSLKAHYTAFEIKEAIAVAHGAVGIITLEDPVNEDVYSFKQEVRDLAFPNLRWLDKQGRPNDHFPELKANAQLDMASTRKFLEATGHSPDEMFAALKNDKLRPFETRLTAKLRVVTKLEDIHCPNIVATLEGSDPALKDQYVVISSHLDHLGIGPAVNGNAVYHGALDNASGSAILLELARAYSQLNPRPKRSLLFVSVNGEEAGLLGSDYFAHYPTVPKSAMVADVNMDLDDMLWPLKDIVAFGAEHSSLDGVAKRAAEKMHLSLSPDPTPEQVFFIRSDQYSFVKQGIPSIYPSPGVKSDDAKIAPLKIQQTWQQTRYHQPSDDMSQPGLLFAEAARYAQFTFWVGYFVAQDQQRPSWNNGDFFGNRYGKK
jgi:hypothetical protein